MRTRNKRSTDMIPSPSRERVRVRGCPELSDQIATTKTLGRHDGATPSAPPHPSLANDERHLNLAPSPSTERGKLSQTAGGEVGTAPSFINIASRPGMSRRHPTTEDLYQDEILGRYFAAHNNPLLEGEG